MTTLGDEALDALYWRAEILQAMYWMHGEGLADAIDGVHLAEFLAAERSVIAVQLRALCADGYLVERAGAFELTPAGTAEGGRSFQDEFAELTRPGHYECAEGCTCHDPAHAGEPCPNRTRRDD